MAAHPLARPATATYGGVGGRPAADDYLASPATAPAGIAWRNPAAVHHPHRSRGARRSWTASNTGRHGGAGRATLLPQFWTAGSGRATLRARCSTIGTGRVRGPFGSLKITIGGLLGPGTLAVTDGRTLNLRNSVTTSTGDVKSNVVGNRAPGATMTLNPQTDTVVATVTGTVTVTGNGTDTMTSPTPIQPR